MAAQKECCGVDVIDHVGRGASLGRRWAMMCQRRRPIKLIAGWTRTLLLPAVAFEAGERSR